MKAMLQMKKIIIADPGENGRSELAILHIKLSTKVYCPAANLSFP